MLRLAAELAAQIREAARRAAPREHCVALLAKTGAETVAETVEIVGALRLRNADGGAGRFAVSEVDMGQARRAAAAQGLIVAAWLHSHPNSDDPALSTADRASLAHAVEPWVILTVAGASGGVFAGYRQVTGEPIAVEVLPGD